MKYFIKFITLAAINFSTAASTPPNITETFEWPEAQPNAIPDLRLSSITSEARSQAREALTRARDAQRATGQAHRRQALKGSMGLGAKPIIVDDETIMTADEVKSGVNSYLIGTISYPNGASMEGIFGPDIGTYKPSPDSPLESFQGWIYGSTTSNPIPMIGVFQFKNGESFVGSYNAGNNAIGIYYSPDKSIKFVGEMDLQSATRTPLRGTLEKGNREVISNISKGR